MKFKKIYIEITNYCNLNCSFCGKDNRIKHEMSTIEFENVLKSINNYTNYIYLHVKGEPLIHSKLDEILKLAKKYSKKVNITTNGTLLKDKLDIIILNKDVIRQINISVHAFKDTDSYLDNIIEVSDYLLKNSNIIISLRLWDIIDGKENSYNEILYKKLISKYNIDYSVFKDLKVKIKDNLYLNKDVVFEWPNLKNTYYNEMGSCMGTRTHIAILSDGSVIPCCLDNAGVINLGNIFECSLESIINSDEFKMINNGFKCNKKIKELCKHCSFYEVINH